MAFSRQIIFAFAACYLVSVSGYKAELRRTMQSCKNGKEVTDAEIEEFVKPLIPTTEEEKCLMACVFKAFNVISADGTYDPKIALAVAKDVLKSEPEKVKKITEVIEHCGDDVPKKMDNECDLAAEIMQCEVKYQKADNGADPIHSQTKDFPDNNCNNSGLFGFNLMSVPVVEDVYKFAVRSVSSLIGVAMNHWRNLSFLQPKPIPPSPEENEVYEREYD